MEKQLKKRAKNQIAKDAQNRQNTNRFIEAKEQRNGETQALVEKHIIRPSSRHFKKLKEFCHLAKNLYNQANYIIRNTFVSKQTWLRYEAIEAKLRRNTEFPDYKNMPTAQCAQQVLRVLDSNWSSFFASIKEWKQNKSKFSGRPRLPKYLPKEDFFVLTVTNQNAKLKKDGLIHFPKSFGEFTVKPLFLNNEETKNGKLQQVRLLFDGVNVICEVVYRIAKPEILQPNDRVMGIDLGVTNIATCATNTGDRPLIFSGGPAKSINQYYNKKSADAHSCSGKRNKQKSTKRTIRLAKKRNQKIGDYIHKVSRRIVDYCVAKDIRTIIIGKNKNWKVAPELSKVLNQKFTAIPLAQLIEKITYKANLKGIAVLTPNESYTSGTSFLDDESPTKEFYNKSRRKKRGLFVSNRGMKINADVNAALQIIKKAVPNAKFADGIEGVVLRPVVVAA